jgi:hypothetical protein
MCCVGGHANGVQAPIAPSTSLVAIAFSALVCDFPLQSHSLAPRASPYSLSPTPSLFNPQQNIQLEKLEKDNSTFKEQLRLAEMDFTAEQATGNVVRELKARYAGYESEIEAELERVAEFDAAIAEAMYELDDERTFLGETQSKIRSAESYQRQIETMENRLQLALNEYDAQLTTNAGLRETIDHLKKERNVFGGLKKRLQAELLEQKKQMGEIIDESNQAYEARDDAQARMNALKERSEKELQESTMELKELNRVLEQERKLKEFMAAKGRDRAKVRNQFLRSAALRRYTAPFPLFFSPSLLRVHEPCVLRANARHRDSISRIRVCVLSDLSHFPRCVLCSWQRSH